MSTKEELLAKLAQIQTAHKEIEDQIKNLDKNKSSAKEINDAFEPLIKEWKDLQSSSIRTCEIKLKVDVSFGIYDWDDMDNNVRPIKDVDVNNYDYCDDEIRELVEKALKPQEFKNYLKKYNEIVKKTQVLAKKYDLSPSDVCNIMME